MGLVVCVCVDCDGLMCVSWCGACFVLLHMIVWCVVFDVVCVARCVCLLWLLCGVRCVCLICVRRCVCVWCCLWCCLRRCVVVVVAGVCVCVCACVFVFACVCVCCARVFCVLDVLLCV